MPSRRVDAGSRSASKPEGLYGALDLARLLDSVEELVLTIDGGAIIRSINAASVGHFGLSPDSMVGRPLFDFVHIGEQHAFTEAIDSLTRKERSSVPLRLRITGADFRRRPIGAVISPYKSGMDELYVLVGRDEANKVKLAPAGPLQPVMRSLGHWRYDLATSVMSWSSSMASVVGFDPEIVYSMDDFAMGSLHPDDRDRVRKIILTAIDNNTPYFYRSRAKGQMGKYLNMETYGIVERGPDGAPKALSGIAYDTTQASESIRLIQESAGELNELFSQISDFVLRVDARGLYLYVSPSVKRVMGYEPHELIAGQKASLEFVHPDDRRELVDAIRSLKQLGESVSVSYRMMHRDGHWVWLESSIRAILMGPNGMAAETAAVARDITARKRSEQELATAYARAEAASATKSRFLANMSHELRTPLNAIIGFSDIIRRELFGPLGAARYKEYAQLILESGGHLLDLINDILDMSKIEAGKLDLRLEPVDLGDLIRSSLKLMEPRAHQARLTLTTDIGEEKRHIQADRRAIKQILLNLLTNAIKFTPAGGTITASLQILADGVAIQVRDTGVGILEKDLPRVTLPFEQATHDPLLAQAGSGLGLALVQSLVNLHMGTLKIDSMPGEGTVVTVLLPADPHSRRAA